MSTPIFYTSEMAGFPVGNTRILGGLTAVLDACLVNGANLTTATSLVQAGGVATANFGGNHNFSVGDTVLVAGATPTAYNGLKKITAKTANSASFAVDSGTASPATGTVTLKHPGAGWTKLDLGTNVVGYRGATVGGGLGHWIQVEDNNPYADSNASARVRAAENLTALDTADALTTVCRWQKNGSSGNRWWFIADDRTFYFGFGESTGPTSTLQFMNSYMAGEVVPSNQTDSYAWMVSRGYNDASTAGGQISRYSNQGESDFSIAAAHGQLMLRSFDGFRTGSGAGNSVLGGFGSSAYLGTSQAAITPVDPRTGRLPVVPVFATENSSPLSRAHVVRGRFRGLYHPLGKMDIFITAQQPAVKTPFPVVIGGVTRDIVLAGTSQSNTGQVLASTEVGIIAFDLSGPWE